MEHTKNLQKQKKIDISLNGKVVSQSESYEYLGVTIDKCLTKNEHLEKTYKKVMSRTILARTRHYISPCVAETIYKVMILPQMMYCSNIMLGMSNTQKLHFEKSGKESQVSSSERVKEQVYSL